MLQRPLSLLLRPPVALSFRRVALRSFSMAPILRSESEPSTENTSTDNSNTRDNTKPGGRDVASLLSRRSSGWVPVSTLDRVTYLAARMSQVQTNPRMRALLDTAELHDNARDPVLGIWQLSPERAATLPGLRRLRSSVWKPDGAAEAEGKGEAAVGEGEGEEVEAEAKDEVEVEAEAEAEVVAEAEAEAEGEGKEEAEEGTEETAEETAEEGKEASEDGAELPPERRIVRLSIPEFCAHLYHSNGVPLCRTLRIPEHALLSAIEGALKVGQVIGEPNQRYSTFAFFFATYGRPIALELGVGPFGQILSIRAGRLPEVENRETDRLPVWRQSDSELEKRFVREDALLAEGEHAGEEMQMQERPKREQAEGEQAEEGEEVKEGEQAEEGEEVEGEQAEEETETVKKPIKLLKLTHTVTLSAGTPVVHFGFRAKTALKNVEYSDRRWMRQARERDGPRQNEGGFRKNEGGFRKNEGGFRKNEGGFRKNEGGFRKNDDGGFRNKNDGDRSRENDGGAPRKSYNRSSKGEGAPEKKEGERRGGYRKGDGEGRKSKDDGERAPRKGDRDGEARKPKGDGEAKPDKRRRPRKAKKEEKTADGEEE